MDVTTMVRLPVWHGRRDLVDVIEVPNQLASTLLHAGLQKLARPSLKRGTEERSSPAGLEAESCRDLCLPGQGHCQPSQDASLGDPGRPWGDPSQAVHRLRNHRK